MSIANAELRNARVTADATDGVVLALSVSREKESMRAVAQIHDEVHNFQRQVSSDTVRHEVMLAVIALEIAPLLFRFSQRLVGGGILIQAFSVVHLRSLLGHVDVVRACRGKRADLLDEEIRVIADDFDPK